MLTDSSYFLGWLTLYFVPQTRVPSNPRATSSDPVKRVAEQLSLIVEYQHPGDVENYLMKVNRGPLNATGVIINCAWVHLLTLTFLLC